MTSPPMRQQDGYESEFMSEGEVILADEAAPEQAEARQLPASHRPCPLPQKEPGLVSTAASGLLRLQTSPTTRW